MTYCIVVRGGVRTDHGHSIENVVKFGHVVFEICERTDRHTYIHTYIHADPSTSQFAPLIWSEIKTLFKFKKTRSKFDMHKVH